MSNIKNYTYNAYVAMLCGVNAATIFRGIAFYQELNQKNDCNLREGRYWVYNSKRAWAELYPHMTENQIRTALESLEEEGLIISTNKFNSNPFDRTKWYSLTPKALEYTERLDLKIPGARPDKKIQSDRGNFTNVARDKGIININTDIKPDSVCTSACAHASNTSNNIISSNNSIIGKYNKLNKPKNIQEVIEEAGKKHCAINESQAQDFIDKYEAVSENGTWVSGKNVVTDWRKLITSGWLKGWQNKHEPSKQNEDSNDRQTLDELTAEIARERAARGQI